MNYGKFAAVYDEMMSEIPYEKWFTNLHLYLKTKGFRGGHLCELGCGTGEMATRFAEQGYEVTGIDLSPDMLALAAAKKKAGQKLFYLNQDMTHFSLHKPADVVLCICDSANYLLREEELYQMFCCVREVLNEGGIFLFDMKTEHCFRDILGDCVRVDEGDGYTVIWDNEYDTDTAVNEYALTLFLQGEGGLYEKYEECHRQKAYPAERVEALLAEAGLEVCDRFGTEMSGPPGPEEERIYIAAVRK